MVDGGGDLCFVCAVYVLCMCCVCADLPPPGNTHKTHQKLTHYVVDLHPRSNVSPIKKELWEVYVDVATALSVNPDDAARTQ